MQSVLNEGSFLDAIESTAKAVGDYAKEAREKNQSTYMRGSVSRYTKKLIMSFPTICDNTIPISTVQMISKAHEKNIVSMFEMLFSAMSLNGTNGVDIIEALHKDLGSSASIDDIIDAIEKAVGVDKKAKNESAIYNSAEIRDIISEMCHDLKYNQKVLPVESLSEHSLNDYIVRDIYGKVTVLEDTTGINKVEKVDAVDESFDEEDLDILGEKYTDKDINDAYSKGYKDAVDKNEEKKKEREEDQKIRSKERKEDQEIRSRERKEDRDAKGLENEIRLNQNRVKDGDYKKANELEPTLVTIVYNEVVTKKDEIQVVGRKSFVAGIKSRLVGSDAMEIVERLTSTAKSKLTFKDLIRATTGEISLVKDFLLALNQTKLNAKNASKRGETAKMWNILAARSKKNNVSGHGLKSNEAAAITTLIINQETVNYIANQYKINIDNAKMASYIMGNYNLLCLVIADEANEVAKFLYDGNNSFEMVAYSALSRDMRDKDYNNTINLINKAGR